MNEFGPDVAVAVGKMLEDALSEGLRKGLEPLETAVERISKGPSLGPEVFPGGLEGIAMALSGPGLTSNVLEGLHSIARAIEDHAEAVRELAKALSKK